MSAAETATVLVELSRDECLRLLSSTQIGRVVVLTPGEGTPVIRPVNYIFDDASQSVVFRCTAGTKLAALVHASRAWFEVDQIDSATRTGWSVIVSGTTEPVLRPMDVARLDNRADVSWLAGAEAQWIRIRARVVSGRRIEPVGPHTEPDA